MTSFTDYFQYVPPQHRKIEGIANQLAAEAGIWDALLEISGVPDDDRHRYVLARTRYLEPGGACLIGLHLIPKSIFVRRQRPSFDSRKPERNRAIVTPVATQTKTAITRVKDQGDE